MKNNLNKGKQLEQRWETDESVLGKRVIEAIMEKIKEEPDSIASIALEELEDGKNSLIHRIEKL